MRCTTQPGIGRQSSRQMPALILALVVGSLAQFMPGAMPILAQEASEYPLEPGDMIQLAIATEPDLSGDFMVDESGHAALPMIGARNVTGIPPSQLKQELQAAYAEQLRNRVVQIILLRRVRVLGAVNNPGLYHVDPPMTLADAIALAGGPTQQGKLDDIRIVRDGREIEASIDGATLHQVRSGDHIVVEQGSWMTRNAAYLVGLSITVVTLYFRWLN